MKYLILLFVFTSYTAFAQSYSEQIAKHREEYKADFLKNENSPLKESDLKHLHFYNSDSSYKVDADVILLEKQRIFKMPTYDGSSADYIRYAHLKFELNGKPFQLTLYKSIILARNPAYKDYLFLPFTDQTNNQTTYGGGRYIDLKTTEISNGKLVIDFNIAYNPYCAYSDGYRCPAPPEENDLSIAILAGEKLFTGDKKH
jgi:uncharacterized protein (DUF1684 family)